MSPGRCCCMRALVWPEGDPQGPREPSWESVVRRVVWAVGSERQIWHTDPATLRDVVLDRSSVEARLA